MAHRLRWGSFTSELQAGLLAHAGQRSSAHSLVKADFAGLLTLLLSHWDDHQPPLTDTQANLKGSFCI